MKPIVAYCKIFTEMEGREPFALIMGFVGVRVGVV